MSASSRAWDGLTDLVEFARNDGIRTETPTRIGMSTLSVRDALLLVHPTRLLPTADLAAFLHRGGRVAIVDDFGRADRALETFGITRRKPGSIDARRRLRGNHNLLVASSEGQHPLSHGAAALVTNHPSVLLHDTLKPVFSLGTPQSAVVLAGAVGQGRLVAVSDSSVLINNMLELGANRAFARNLAQYLAGDGGGTLYVLGSDAELTGTTLTSADPIIGLNDALARIAEIQLPGQAVMALSLVLSALLLFGAASSLPRRTAYARRLDAPECMAGYAGRVRRYSQRRADFGPAVVTLKLELELESRLAAPAAAARARALLAQIDALQTRAHGSMSPVDARKFRKIVASGRRILAEFRTLPTSRT